LDVLSPQRQSRLPAEGHLSIRMEFKFDASQEYQINAIEAVARLRRSAELEAARPGLIMA
jgi:hypothetical protein